MAAPRLARLTQLQYGLAYLLREAVAHLCRELLPLVVIREEEGWGCVGGGVCEHVLADRQNAVTWAGPGT